MLVLNLILLPVYELFFLWPPSCALWSLYSLPCIEDSASYSSIVQALPRFQKGLESQKAKPRVLYMRKADQEIPTFLSTPLGALLQIRSPGLVYVCAFGKWAELWTGRKKGRK